MHRVSVYQPYSIIKLCKKKIGVGGLAPTLSTPLLELGSGGGVHCVVSGGTAIERSLFIMGIHGQRNLGYFPPSKKAFSYNVCVIICRISFQVLIKT